MTDRPIIFSAPMIRVLLDGRKTQTRRIIKPQPNPFQYEDGSLCEVGLLHIEGDALPRITLGRVVTAQCLPFAVGWKFWVREAWRTFVSLDDRTPAGIWPRYGKGAGVAYEADGGLSIEKDTHQRRETYESDLREDIRSFGKIRSPIHMPRWASRLTLIVEQVRVQRVQEISEEDARAEGCDPTTCANVVSPKDGFPSYRSAFGILWNTIHGEGAYQRNDWVAALTFRVVKANIDSREAGKAEIAAHSVIGDWTSKKTTKAKLSRFGTGYKPYDIPIF